ncbi:MAG: glutamate racemase [Verrucomicrobiota bacterium]|nr:glutamate racemase [Verrucomicrobiota bacterium]
MNHSSIGLFDSGFGGLTVMREVAEQLPHENLIYFGDTAHLPYGNKSAETILQYAFDNAQFLLDQGIKLLIISCHTACSYAFEALQQKLSIPVIGVREPGIEALLQATRTKQVAVLGTRATIASGFFQAALQSRQIDVHAIACPLFVPFVEEGLPNHPAAKLIIEHYLAPLKRTAVDTVLLACTHYPLLREAIQEALGSHIQLIEPAPATALAARDLLKKRKLLNPGTSPPVYQFYTSDDPQKFRQLAKLFFPRPIEQVLLSPCKK